MMIINNRLKARLSPLSLGITGKGFCRTFNISKCLRCEEYYFWSFNYDKCSTPGLSNLVVEGCTSCMQHQWGKELPEALSICGCSLLPAATGMRALFTATALGTWALPLLLVVPRTRPVPAPCCTRQAGTPYYLLHWAHECSLPQLHWACRQSLLLLHQVCGQSLPFTALGTWVLSTSCFTKHTGTGAPAPPSPQVWALPPYWCHMQWASPTHGLHHTSVPYPLQ